MDITSLTAITPQLKKKNQPPNKRLFSYLSVFSEDAQL